MDTVETRIARHRLEDLHRLAQKAERCGSRILHVDGTSTHVATSATSPIAYAVTVNGCTCKGFATWGRCGHWALLLSELGQLPDLARPATATCPTCEGSGVDPDCHGHRVAGGSVSCPCDGCQGTGTVEVDVLIAERPALVA